MINVLFVCLGNICRSPMAEGVFKFLVEENNLTSKIYIDSAGVAGYHIGELPDQRMRETASNHGIELTSRARKFIVNDFKEFDYIIPMDDSNYSEIMNLATSENSEKYEVIMMRKFDKLKSGKGVDDPYWGGQEGFENCYQVLKECNSNFLNFLIEKHNLK